MLFATYAGDTEILTSNADSNMTINQIQLHFCLLHGLPIGK